MKKIIGLITVFALSSSVFAEDMHTKEMETKLIESDVAAEMMPDSQAHEGTMHEQEAMPEMAIKEQSGFSRGSVVRSAFTRDVAEREPTEDLQKLTNDNGQVKFFTELRDMSGQTAIHRWEYDGKVVAEVKFNVKGPRWRVWSSKKFVPEWTGDWKVSVLNGAGEVISEKNLSYDVAAMPESKMTDMPAATKTEHPDSMM